MECLIERDLPYCYVCPACVDRYPTSK